MGEDAVDDVGGAIGVFLRACLVSGLLQRTVDEAVLGVHDGRLRVAARLLLHAGIGHVAGQQQLLALGRLVLLGHVLAHVLQHMTVVLQQFDGQIARRIALADMLVGLQVLLNVADALLYLVAVVDVQMARGPLLALVDLDDSPEEILDAQARLERGGTHGHAEERRQRGDVHRVAAALKLVVHVQGTHRAQVHVHQLGGQVEIALQIAGIHHVDHHIGHLRGQMLAHVEFLGRIAGERVGAGQVGEQKLIAEHLGMGLGGIDGNARIVAHVGMGPRGIVEERRLAAIRITDEGHIDGAAFTQGHVLQKVILVSLTYLVLRKRLGLTIRHDLYLLSLLMAQRDLVAHQFVFHRVLQRGIEKHLHSLAFHKAHLDDALAEASVAEHLDDDATLASL